jgi:hypothetical protein
VLKLDSIREEENSIDKDINRCSAMLFSEQRNQLFIGGDSSLFYSVKPLNVMSPLYDILAYPFSLSY